jgi:xylulokinase
LNDALMGVDLGTGSMKALLVTPEGKTLGQTAAEYPMHQTRPGWNENDPDDWVRAFRQCVALLAAKARTRGVRVRALALVGQRDPFVLLDAQGRPTANSISWTDQRSHPQAEYLRGVVGQSRLVQLAGARPITGLGLPNLLWIRQHQPEVWAATTQVVAPKDYVLRRIAGVHGTDFTTPTRSMAYDIAQRRWSSEILEAARIEVSMFDQVVRQPWQPCTPLKNEWADQLGLEPDVVLASGSADDQAATLGAGAVQPGQVCLGTGTCSDWRAVVDSYLPDLSGHVDTAPHAVPDRYIREVANDSTGSSLRWFRNELCRDLAEGLDYEQIVDLAMQAPAGSDGLQFFPFVAGGERAPYYQEHASGVFFGITSSHTRSHVARAILEGVAFLYPATRALLDAPKSPDPLTMVDGEASSPGWTQLKADVLGEPIRVTEVLAAAAIGAAILASVSAGLYPDVTHAARAMVRYGPVTEPREPLHQAYAEFREKYEHTFEHVRAAYRHRTREAPI